MKIRICLLSFFLLLFCGCGKKDPPVPVFDFSAVAVIRADSSLQNPCEIYASVVSSAPKVVTITVTEPKRLSGLSFCWGQEFEMSYNELAIKGDAQYLPDDSFARVIYDVLEDMGAKGVCRSFEGEVATFAGEISAGEYCALTDSKGYIQEISVEEINLHIDFTYR